MSNLFFKEKIFIKRLKYLFKTLKGRHFMLPHKKLKTFGKRNTLIHRLHLKYVTIFLLPNSTVELALN